MYLKNIHVTGFKSFGSKNVLDFPEVRNAKSKSFAAVVGPNGSGKSNIADAIRWVLGEQSSKLLRVKKGEDVIFFGSAKKGKGSFTEISMTLDNSDKSAEIDFSEVEVARRLYRNGDNDYFINRKKVRLFDVQELLAKCGIGRSTYTVIGQGMVDSLLFYGPAERKVLFEEASGVKQYEIKRAESLRKLDATDKNIIRIRDLLFELEPRLKTAERQFKKFQKKKDIEAELDELSRKYYSNVFTGISGKKEKLQKSLTDFKVKETALQSEITELEAKIAKGLKVEGSDGQEKELRSKIDALSAQKDDLARKIYQIEAENEAAKSVFSREKEELASEKARIGREIDSLQQKVAKIIEENEENQTRLESAKKELAEIDKRIILSNETLLKVQRESLNLTKDDIRQKVEEIYSHYNEIVGKMNSVADLKSFGELKKEAEKVANSMQLLIADIKKSQNSDTSLLESKQNEIRGLTQNKEKVLSIVQDLRVQSLSKSDILKNSQAQEKYLKEKLGEFEVKTASLKGPKEAESAQKLEDEKAKIEMEISDLKKKLADMEAKNTSGDYTKILESQKEKRREISEVQEEISSANIDMARIETREEDLKEEIHEFLGESFYQEIKKAKVNAQENVGHLLPKIQRLRKDMYALGEIDVFVGEEFEELQERVGGLKEQYEDLEKAKNDIQKVISELDQRIKTQFKTTFIRISEEFTKYFKILFGGGNAALNLETDEEGNFGVEITATPPGKKNQSLNSLSGGERALTSIALLFAILSVNPSPFCVLDEVDASLDETNTERFLEILKTLSHKTQFVVVTHNRETMKKSDIIYGVSMDDNHVSQVYSLKLTEVS